MRQLAVILLAVSVVALGSPALAQSSGDIQSRFANSIASRMGMTPVSCNGWNAFFRKNHKPVEVYCFEQHFADFASLLRAWTAAAVWKDVVEPDEAWVAQNSQPGTIMIGNWEAFTQTMVKKVPSAGPFSQADVYSAQYLMHAARWGFSGAFYVQANFPMNNSGARQDVEMTFFAQSTP